LVGLRESPPIMTRPDYTQGKGDIYAAADNVKQPSSTVVGGWSELPLLPPEHLPFVRPNLDGPAAK